MADNLKPYADLKVALRKYKDSEGNEKTAWLKIGTLMASPHLSHMFVILEALPLNKDWNGAVSVFKKEEADQALEPQSGLEKARATAESIKNKSEEVNF